MMASPLAAWRWSWVSILAILTAIVGLALASAQVVTRDAMSTMPSPASVTGETGGETYLWRPVAIGGGGFIVGVSADRRGRTLVARTDVHGAYVWRSRADRWAQLLTAATVPPELRRAAGLDTGVEAIAVAPSDGRWIYLVAKGRVLRSSDGGQHWGLPEPGALPPIAPRPAEFMKTDPALAISPRDPRLVLLGTARQGLWRSADGGRRWQRAGGIDEAGTGKTAPILVWFTPPASHLPAVWAIVPGRGLMVSTDDGVSFAAATGPKSLAAGDFAPDGSFYGADPDGKTMWRYHDGAWTDLVATGALRAARFVAVAVNPGNGDVFAFEHNGRAHRSNTGGASWRRLPVSARVGVGDPPWLRIANHPFFATAQVKFDPVVPNRLWIAAGTGMFYADVPHGAMAIEWISRTRGIEELVTNDVVQPPGRAPLFAAWDFGIHMKPDLDAFSTGYGPKERVLIAAQQLALTPADPAFIVTNASDTRPCCAEDGDAVLAGYSEDAGRTWRKFATLPQPPGTRADDPWRMAFGTIAVSSGDPDTIVWMPSFDRAPFYTRDRGRTWERVSFPGERLPFTGSHAAKHLQRKVLVADPVRSNSFYLAHSGTASNPQLAGLWRTQDGGATWVRRFAGEIAPASRSAAKLRAMPGREGDLWFTAGMNAGPDTRLRRSTDGGATWRIVPGYDRVDDVAFGKAARGARAPAVFVSGYRDGTYGIWRSIDGGNQWRRVAGLPLGTLDRVTVLGADPDVFGRVYVGLMGSGWMYGQPAPCRARALRPFDASECYVVR